jgi:chromosome segregation ATPase
MSADKLEARVSDLEQYFKMLVEMLRRYDERLDEGRAEQSNTDERIAALADAQIRAEEAQSHADERIAALADAQIRTEDAITRMSARVDRLAETVDRYIVERDGKG